MGSQRKEQFDPWGFWGENIEVRNAVVIGQGKIRELCELSSDLHTLNLAPPKCRGPYLKLRLTSRV